MRAVILVVLVVPRVAGAQEAAAESAPKIPKIPDEPKTVDPATILPESVTKRGTVAFDEAPLSEVATWAQETTGMPVVVDTLALSEFGVLLTDPVTDRLNEEPVYLLLNRLRLLELAWFVQDDVIHITTNDVANDPMNFQTRPYNVGDLLDAGHTSGRLIETVKMIAGVNWEEADGTGGSVESLGDVLFVQQTRAGHRQVAALLKAIRKHGRRTLVLDPPEHEALRSALEANVDVDLRDIPLKGAAQELSQQTGIDIRLDYTELKGIGVRGREPVSLVLNQRPLKTVLKLLLRDLELTWTPWDGVVWVTTVDAANVHLLTAVYDVRDLCRNTPESTALQRAIQTQTKAQWSARRKILFPKPGTMVVLQTHDAHDNVLSLLDAYRQALLASKNRLRSDPANEISTRYYRMQTRIAEALLESLPRLVGDDSWKTEERPEASGSMFFLPSEADPEATAAGVQLDFSVLAVTQSRRHHEQIGELIDRIQHGDHPLGKAGGGLGGGFGGGFFRVTSPRAHREEAP